jgi:purine-binding chemotaxis protein CheW
MAEKTHFLIFTLDDQKFALPLSSVEKITRAAAIRPLPKASDVIMGVINVQGRILPVLNLRLRFGIPSRPIALTDHLIITRTSTRTLALLVDSVQEIMEIDSRNVTDQATIMDRMDYVEGVLKTKDDMVLIHDLEHVLSLDEAKLLEQALQKGGKLKKQADGAAITMKDTE